MMGANETALALMVLARVMENGKGVVEGNPVALLRDAATLLDMQAGIIDDLQTVQRLKRDESSSAQ